MGTAQTILDARDFANSTNSFPYGRIAFLADDKLQYQESYNGDEIGLRVTSQVFSDPSAWYHIVVALNTTLPTTSDRVKLYVNGSQITSFSSSINPSSYTSIITSNKRHCLAGNITATSGVIGSTVDGYLTEVYLIDGQALTPSSFGQIESTTGVWSPKQYVGTYGTNGFYLKFSDASAATAAAIGKDSSGNGNNWTPNNISVTPGVTYDSMLDVPVNYSDSGNGRGNYAVLNPLLPTAATTVISNGNLRYSNTAGVSDQVVVDGWATISKQYYECTVSNVGASSDFVYAGDNQGYYCSNGKIFIDGSLATTVATYTSNDVLGFAVTVDGAITFYKNNTAVYTSSGTAGGRPLCNGFNSTLLNLNFGQRPFNTVNGLPPAGFFALNTQNLPTPSIVNGANFMAATAYTGNATARSLSNVVNGVSFQPDLVWIKNRTAATNHALFDSTRGVTKYLSSNTAAVEGTLAQGLTAFNADGFSLGTDTTLVNSSTGGANSYIAWQWKESITAGLDVVSYTGNNISGTGISHNLGVIPSFVIIKSISNSTRWLVKGPGVTGTNVLSLNETTELTAGSNGYIGTLTSSVIQISGINTNSDINALGATYVAYCFAEISGFSKFGTYAGNGSTNGPFVFCGFKPKFVMYKSISGGANGNWQIFDSTRDTYNPIDENSAANVVTTALGGTYIDILSNGFKLRTNSNAHNGSGVTFVFAAFAEVPSKYALAR